MSSAHTAINEFYVFPFFAKETLAFSNESVSWFCMFDDVGAFFNAFLFFDLHVWCLCILLFCLFVCLMKHMPFLTNRSNGFLY